MGEERSRVELVNGSRANALAKKSADDRNRETNQRYANRMFSNNRQDGNSRKQKRQQQQ